MLLLSFLFSLLFAENDIYQLLAEGKTSEAIIILEKTVETEPTEDAYILLLRLYTEQNRFVDIIEIMPKIESRFLNSVEIKYNIANANYFIGNRAEAINLLELIILEESHILTLQRLGTIYFENGDWSKVEIIYSDLAKHKPENHFFQTRLAQSLSRQQLYPEAIEILETIYAINPSYVTASFELGSAYLSEQKYEEARFVIDQSLTINQNHSGFWNLSARLYYETQNFRGSAMDWKKVLEIEGPENMLLKNIALSFYRLGDEEKALEYFIMVLDDDMEDLTALMYAAIIYRNQKDFVRADQLFDLLYDLQITQMFQDTLVQRAFTKEQIGNVGGARGNYELLLSLKPELSVVHYYLGSVLEKHRGYWNDAIMHYNLYIDSKDTDPNLENQARARIRNLNEQMFFQE